MLWPPSRRRRVLPVDGKVSMTQGWATTQVWWAVQFRDSYPCDTLLDAESRQHGHMQAAIADRTGGPVVFCVGEGPLHDPLNTLRIPWYSIPLLLPYRI